MSDKELLDFPIEFLDVVITNKSIIGKSIAELAAMDFARGVFLKKLTRTGQTMPFCPETRVERGDLMTLIGAEKDVERAAKSLGYADRKTVMTDMIFVGLGIFLGGLVGLLTVVVAGLPLTLTASGGALIMGLVFGWLRAVHPTFGRIPESAMWVFDTVGLTVFMACVGLAAGPSFFSGLQKSGISLVFVGLDHRDSAAHRGDFVRPLCVEDESGHPPGRLCRRRDDHRRAARHPGRGAERTADPRLHRALCDRQHRADGMGSGAGRHDVVDPRQATGTFVKFGRHNARRSLDHPNCGASAFD